MHHPVCGTRRRPSKMQPKIPHVVLGQAVVEDTWRCIDVSQIRRYAFTHIFTLHGNILIWALMAWYAWINPKRQILCNAALHLQCQHWLKCVELAARIDRVYDAKWKTTDIHDRHGRCVYEFPYYALQYFDHQMFCIGWAASGLIFMAQTPLCTDGAWKRTFSHPWCTFEGEACCSLFQTCDITGCKSHLGLQLFIKLVMLSLYYQIKGFSCNCLQFSYTACQYLQTYGEM